MPRKNVRAVISSVMLVLAGLSGADAQTYQDGLRGQVRDSQGVIPGAEVVLLNEETNASRSAISNEVSEYVFASVLPGTYTVTVSLPGFKTEERKGMRVGTQQQLQQDFRLEVGAISEQITVTTRRARIPTGAAPVSGRPTSPSRRHSASAARTSRSAPTC